MTSIYGHKWSSSYGPNDSGDVWLLALSGLTPRDLANGLNKCVISADPWPPSAPEFRAMCMASAEDYGLVDARRAYNAACEYYGRKGDPTRKKLHSTIVEAVRLSGGSMFIASHNAKEGFPQFKREYEQSVKRFIAGETVEPAPALEHNMREPSECEKQAAQKYAGYDTDDQAAQAARSDLKKLRW